MPFGENDYTNDVVPHQQKGPPSTKGGKSCLYGSPPLQTKSKAFSFSHFVVLLSLLLVLCQ
jgi:hypothetical protein